jgi:L-malate glycosyltransferase
MKIAFVSDYSYPYTKGGVETRYYTLAQYLIKKGHSITWFTSRQWDGQPEQLVEGVRIRCISGRLKAYAGHRRSILQALTFGLLSTKLLFLPEHFDVLDMSQYPFFHLLIGRLYARLRHTPVIVSWYEYWGEHWLEYLGTFGRAGQKIEKLMARMKGHKIVISEQSMKQLVSVGCGVSTLHYVPNWIDYEHILSLKAIGDPYDACYFGRLKDHKNVHVLIRAIALCRVDGLVLRVKILGDGPERQNLEKITQDLQLGSQIEFLGRIEQYDDLLGYVKSARLFVNPSTKEGGGSITCLEANACGVPVLAVCHPLGLDDSLIAEGKNGYWATEASPEALAKKLREHFNGEARQYALMSQNSIKWADQYSIQNLCRKVESIYQELALPNTKGE